MGGRPPVAAMIAGEVGELIAYWMSIPVILAPTMIVVRVSVWGLRSVAERLEYLIRSA
jgi:hypothetical protein